MDGSSQILSRQEHVQRRLRALTARPPQSLVLEGGTAAERQVLALFWAKRLNCPQGGEDGCEICRQIEERVFRDLIVVDEAFHGEGASVAVSEVRKLLPVWGQPPHGEGRRVTIFPEAQDLNVQVSNTLLKTLEEPRPGNVFVLTSPQRERLLPTLVSRSFTLTLAWPGDGEPDADAEDWVRSLLGFWETGRGWFGRTMGKGALDRPLAQRVLLELMRVQRRALSREASPEAQRLCRLFDAGRLRRLDLALAQSQDALTAQANPALVLDWLASRFVS